jgi:Uncharacterized membrane-associated protein/domain
VKASLSGAFSVTTPDPETERYFIRAHGTTHNVNAAVTDFARDVSAIVADSLLSRGPPWTRESGGPDRLVVLSIVLLGVAVLLLGVALFFLWRRQFRAEQFPAERGDTGAGQPDESTEVSELDRIRQIDATVDGRLPQQEIVEQTDWSEAKVSRVVSGLAEDGQLEKIRIGRQNFIQVKTEADATGGESENRPTA